MKRIPFLLIVALSLGATCPPASQVLDRVCDPGAAKCISLSAFQSGIDAQLNGKVVGDISVVGGLPQVVKYGSARTGADTPQLGWDSDVPINMMSLAKVFTTIAALQVLARDNVDLGTKISAYLPPDWTQGANISNITFHDLLTHQSGFRSNGATDYASMKATIAAGVTLANYGQAKYDNENFSLFRVLLPFVDHFTDPGAATRDQVTSTWYISYLQKNVFGAVGVTDADCKPWGGKHNGLFYAPPPLAANATGDDAGDWTLQCGGGGWTLTTSDVFKVLLSLQADNRLLTDAQKTRMNSECLGWDCSVQTQSDFVGKNGIWNTNGRGEQMFMGLFHNQKVLAVVVVNSPPPLNITQIVATAFNASWVPNN